MKNHSAESLPIATILVGKGTSQVKSVLYRVLEATVVVHQRRTTYEKASIDVFGGVVELGFGVAGFDKTSQGTRLYQPQIHINSSDFILEGHDYRDLTPFVELHEKTEMWNMAGRDMWTEETTPETDEYRIMSHRSALLAEYGAAIHQDKGQRHLSFMLMFGELRIGPTKRKDFIEDNLWAYETVNNQVLKREKM